MENRLEGGRAGLAMVTAGILILAMFALYARSPADAQANPATECISDSWNGGYWKIQVNDGVLTNQIESDDGEGNDIDDAITLNSDGSWVNNHDDPVFRIILKVGQGQGSDVIHEPPVNPIDLTTSGLSHVTFCFSDPPTTTSSSTSSTTSSSTTSSTTTTTEPTTTTTEPTTTTQVTTATTEATTTTIEDEVLGTVVTSTTEAPTTTVEDEVAGTHVLPFTGIESDQMAMLAMALLGGGILTLVGSQSIRRRHEE